MTSRTHSIDTLSVYLHCAYFLTGVGVMMIGPLLPLLALQWHLSDSHGGILLAAQFIGSFCGAVLLQSELRNSLTLGNIALIFGTAALAAAVTLPNGFRLASAALLTSGFGCGQIINAVSLIAGRRSNENRGSALMSLNLTWSTGALLAPVYIGLGAHVLSLALLPALFAAAALLLLGFQHSLHVTQWQYRSQKIPLAGTVPRTDRSYWKLIGYFAALFFLYGALENTLSGWISSFAARYAAHTASSAAYFTTVLWLGITAGRALGLLLLRRFTEREVERMAVLTATLAAASLILAENRLQLVLLTAVVGCGLAPFLPVTTALLLAEARPATRHAGFILAVPALGAALGQWTVGQLSQQLGSLKPAMELPAFFGAVLLLLCLFPPRRAISLSLADSDGPP